jgi:glycosyltransferase involved in cell wall biosynthesis
VIDVLTAVRKIKAKGVHDIQFNIAGDGPQKEKLLKYVQDNQLSDIVSFLGWVQPKELPSLLKKSDVFIGPSVIDDDGWTEAFGLVFVEAAAAGLPVIATNVGGIKDIVEDTITGFLVDQRSPDQLADKIVMLKNNEKLRIKMSKAAVEKSDAFSWDKSSSSYYEILRNI